MYATGVIIILVAVLYVLFWIAVSAGIVYLFILIVKALKKYVNSKEVREEKKAVAKSLGEALKENRIRCQMTQEFVAETLGVSRQSVSKWENGKSIPDEASLNLLYQCLEINNEEKTILQKLAHNKQTIFLIVIALVFSPIIIGIRYCLFTMGKLEDKRFKIVIQTVGFILFAFYLRSLKDNVAYLLISITSSIYLTYQSYMFSLEND